MKDIKKRNITHWMENKVNLIDKEKPNNTTSVLQNAYDLSSSPISIIWEKVAQIPDTIFKENLNHQQRDIIKNLEGVHLINAGAGSGKTRTITFSILKLLKNNVDPRSILLMTFTNKAAKDMKEKLEALIGMRITGMLHGTFHSIGNHYIRLFGDLLALGDPTILDESDSKQEMKEVVNEFFRKVKKRPSKFDIVNIEREREIHTPNLMKELISFAINCDKSINQVIQERFSQEGFNIKIVNSILKRYRVRKERLSLLDFDDLLYYWRGLLDYKEVQDHISRFKYILIDELQDTNTIQFQIIEKIKDVNKEANLIVVGDEDQSIYGFRGANYKNVRKFIEKFKDCIVHPLTYNYRSTQPILDLANSSIINNTLRLRKKLEQDPEKIRQGEIPILINTNDDSKQGEILSKKILEFLNSGYLHNQIAILVRNSSCFGKIEYHLKRDKIPYELRGGLSLFQKAHIKLILALLQLLVNSKNISAWRRISRMVEGIGSKGITELHRILINEKNPINIIINERKLLRYQKTLKINKNGLKRLSQLFLKLSQIFNPKDKSKLLNKSLGQLLEVPIIKDSITKIYGKTKSYEKRIEDLHQLPAYAENLTNPQLNEYISRLTLDQKDFGNNYLNDNKLIVISTIHQAKGLEWDIVFVASLVNDIFPDFRSKSLEKKEEERRLFYVAVTRAKDKLYLTSYQIKKEEHYEKELELSQFVQELNPNIYRNESI